MKPAGIDFSLLFFPEPDMIATIQSFFEKTLSKEADIPMSDAKKVAQKIGENMKTLLVQDYTSG